MSEDELRQLWADEYCDKSKPIYTHDAIMVSFYEDMFDHSFYESFDRKEKDKSILSYNRLEKILWITATLQDPEAVLKKGWDRDNKTYDNTRRVAFIKGNYVVIIRFTGKSKAKFMTAYEIQEDDNLEKIKESPEWDKEDKYY